MAQSELPPQVNTVVQAYMQALLNRFGARVVDVLLFGSRARGDAVEDSDTDLIVIVADPTDRELQDVRGLAFDTWLSHHVLLSIRAFSRRNWQDLETTRSLFFRNVMHDGFSLLNATAVSSQSLGVGAYPCGRPQRAGASPAPTF